jgi:hypothetical protein
MNKLSPAEIKAQKVHLLNRWKDIITRATTSGIFGKMLDQPIIYIVPGPRAGVLHILAGMNSTRMLQVLSQQNYIMLANTVPWDFSGDPVCYRYGRFVRLEAGWNDELADTRIPLRSVGANPNHADQWVAGRDELDRVIAPSFDTAAHWLIGGATGSGKTVAMTTAVAQMARVSLRTNETHFVLIDGKRGEGLVNLSHIPRLIGPMAYERESAFRALNWVVREMIARYTKAREIKALATAESLKQYDEWFGKLPRIVVVIDEIQVFTGRQDGAMVEMVSQIAAQGRACKINLIVGTQHPVNDVFGDNQIKSNLDGRIALLTTSQKASEVVLGATEPRADHLLGRGDAYIKVPGKIARTQIAYLDAAEILSLPATPPTFTEAWPDADPTTISADLTENAVPRGRGNFAKVEPGIVAAGIISALHAEGRPAFQKRTEEMGFPVRSTESARVWLEFCRDVQVAIEEAGYYVAQDNAFNSGTDDESTDLTTE